MPEFRRSDERFEAAPDGASRARALGQFLLFAVFVFVMISVLGTLVARLRLPGVGLQVLKGNLIVAAAALAVTAIFARIQGISARSFGLGGRHKGWNFAFGAGMGFILLTALLLVLRGVSGFRFGPAGSTGLESFEFGLLYAAVFGAVSLAEETMWRGYALVCLSRALSFWPAAIVLGAIFGAVHLNHSTENYLGISAAALFGLVFAWSFRCTGSLWFALGVHAGWDYSQSFIYGVPDSGVVLPGALLRPHMGGPAWLTGGSAGPEGSVLMAAVLACVVLCVRFVRTTE